MDGSTNASNVGGTVGSDTKPIKIVDGKAVAVNYELLPLNIITHKIRVSNVDIGSGDNVIMMSAFNNSFEARLVVVAQGTACRLQLEKWSLDGSQLLAQTYLADI